MDHPSSLMLMIFFFRLCDVFSNYKGKKNRTIYLVAKKIALLNKNSYLTMLFITLTR